MITAASSNGKVWEKEVPGSFMNMVVHLSIVPLLGEWKQVAQLALEKVAKEGCLCLLVNTVKEAQTLFCELQAVTPDGVELLLFHAHYTARRKQEIEKNCLKAFGKEGKHPQSAILVATQVVEQSLDLDFDTMITAIAPIDLILQRIGRVHRHQGHVRPSGLEEPHITVLTPTCDIRTTPTAAVYASWILKQTIEALRDHCYLHLPENIRPLVERVYGVEPKAKDDDYLLYIKLAKAKIQANFIPF